MAINTRERNLNTVNDLANQSFDGEYGVFVVENLVFNPATGNLERQLSPSPLEYMGKKISGSYTYFGFKQKGSPDWKIMRKDGTDEGAWAYAYSSDGGNDWATAWATPSGESYGDPPDA